ncbi:MAG: hypothetical protein J6X28_03410 [Bacilli bacterium]|nr:hypothetical protein [Bacilli bacterium]
MVSGGTVTSDLSEVSSCFSEYSSVISGLSGAWKGLSYDNISTKSEACVSEFLGVISSQMSSFAAACDLYPKYEDTKNRLVSLKNTVYNVEDSRKANYYSQISTLENELSTLKAQIEGYLGAVSGHLEASSSDNSSSSSSSSVEGLTPSFGSLTVQSFTSSNNINIKYLLYIPDYGQEVSGLPVHMYMTGASMKSTGEHIMTDGGIGKLLNEKNINPSGIVIVPYVPSGHEYESEAYRKALAELPKTVCKQYNGDESRISLSGHSYGAITAYNLVNENPDEFSAIVPVSGSKPPTEAFKNVKVWAFHGAQDNPGNNTDYKKAVKNIKAIQEMGGEATLHSYTEYPNCYHTHTGNYTFANQFDDPDEDDDDDEEISPLEWAFKQKRTVKA